MDAVIEPGTVIEGYRVLHPLGRGGFGEVWEAEAVSTGTLVAIKFLRFDFRDPPHGQNLQARFRQEAQILARLEHPGLVRILGGIEREDPPILAYVMERLYGRPLDALTGHIEIGALIHALRRVAEALDYLHKRGILHRDVKGGNIFVCDEGSARRVRPIKLLDFGIAKPLRGAVRTQTGVFLGTMAMTAPEGFDRLINTDIPMTPAMDQWSFGVTIFRMLTGRKPFTGGSLLEMVMAIRRDPPADYPFLTNFTGDPAAMRLKEVAFGCLEKSPDERYADMQMVSELLQEIEQSISSIRRQEGRSIPSDEFEQIQFGHIQEPQFPFSLEGDADPREPDESTDLSEVFAALSHDRKTDDLRPREVEPITDGSTLLVNEGGLSEPGGTMLADSSDSLVVAEEPTRVSSTPPTDDTPEGLSGLPVVDAEDDSSEHAGPTLVDDELQAESVNLADDETSPARLVVPHNAPRAARATVLVDPPVSMRPSMSMRPSVSMRPQIVVRPRRSQLVVVLVGLTTILIGVAVIILLLGTV